ncbi:MAG: PEGA domain-containing protein [Armatimonadota bacterium]|nr:PEGA domain-containing protein [Armatimonadota bacterium]
MSLAKSSLKKAQMCPMCNTPLPAGALFCETCGTDLSRASVVLSAYVRPVSRSRFGGARIGRVVGLAAGVLAAFSLALAGLGSIPEVSARVPVIARLGEPIRDAFSEVISWGSRGGQPRPAPVAAPVPPPVVSAPPLPPPAPVPSTASLTVQSTPAGADVFMDDERVGKTPLTLKQLRPGSYVVRVARKGYVATSKKVDLKPNTGLTVTLNLKPAARPALRTCATATSSCRWAGGRWRTRPNCRRRWSRP